ncbi:MAG: DUF418 domain-containing protein [Pyrinomonadaceae bacterium]
MREPESSAPAVHRLEFIDSLRGFALFGVFWANLLIFSGISYMTNEQRASSFTSRLDSIAYSLVRFFIENKFMGLFSFLFGISFWLFLGSVRSRSGPATSLFYRRIFWLFAIGLIHGWLFWCFDILRFYALWAILLPLFLRIAPTHLLYVALTTGILMPAVVAGLRAWMNPVAPTTDFDAMALAAFSNGSYREFLVANWKYDWYLTNSIGQIAYQVAMFGRLLLGLYVAQALDLAKLDAHRKVLLRVILVGGLAGLVGSTIFAGNLLSGDTVHPFLSFIRRFLVESGQFGLSLLYAAALALAFLTARWRPAIRLLAPMGRMALTWYLLQTVFGIWLFYGFARGPSLMGKVGPSSLAALALVGFLVQVVCARLWLSRFRFGPAEWLWRTLTYWKIQPL